MSGIADCVYIAAINTFSGVSMAAPAPKKTIANGDIDHPPSMVNRAVAFPFKVLGKVFFTDFKLQREGAGVRIRVTEPVPLQVVQAPVFATMSSTPLTEIEVLRTELKDVLDEQPNARRVLRHLVYVEAAIAEHGLTFVTKVPVDVLAKALGQLEGLVTNRSQRGLASLRSMMAASVMERVETTAASPVSPVPSTGFSPCAREAQATIDSSEFLELAKMYEGLLTAEEIEAVKADFAPARHPSSDGT